MTGMAEISDYGIGLRDRQRQILEEITKLLLAWGHHNSPSCITCTTVRLIVAGITALPYDDVRIIDGVKISGRPS
jgi:hypothetical protein